MEHVCCGRPLYDHGFLDEAKQHLRQVMRVLAPYMERQIPIVLLEPSCWSVLRDEIHGLFPEREETRQILENTFLLSEFLTDRATLLSASAAHGRAAAWALSSQGHHPRC